MKEEVDMPVSTANTSIALDVHSPLKDRVVAVGVPTVGVDDLAVWAGSAVNPELTQSVIGTLDVLVRYLLNNLNGIAATGPTILHVLLGDSEGSVTVDGVPGTDEVQLHVGANLITKGQSHFIDRTHKRLREAWLEEN